jgi:hypothetical protein
MRRLDEPVGRFISSVNLQEAVARGQGYRRRILRAGAALGGAFSEPAPRLAAHMLLLAEFVSVA